MKSLMGRRKNIEKAKEAVKTAEAEQPPRTGSAQEEKEIRSQVAHLDVELRRELEGQVPRRRWKDRRATAEDYLKHKPLVGRVEAVADVAAARGPPGRGCGARRRRGQGCRCFR